MGMGGRVVDIKGQVVDVDVVVEDDDLDDDMDDGVAVATVGIEFVSDGSFLPVNVGTVVVVEAGFTGGIFSSLLLWFWGKGGLECFQIGVFLLVIGCGCCCCWW
jgi:hypothetical protein